MLVKRKYLFGIEHEMAGGTMLLGLIYDEKVRIAAGQKTLPARLLVRAPFEVSCLSMGIFKMQAHRPRRCFAGKIG